MVAPTVALRFRDTTFGVDTIEQHREILEARGAVWWGWWKKDFEGGHSDFFESAPDVISLLILDRSTSRMFLAHSQERIVASDSLPDSSLVPPYYRHSVNDVHGWFRLLSIEAIEYDEEVANKFGDGTAIVLGEVIESAKGNDGKDKAISARSSILVLSDLHFGPDYDFLKQGEVPTIGSEKQTLTECLVRDLRRIGLDDDIGTVMVTGDFTSNGKWDDNDIAEISGELNALAAELDVDIKSFLALPGNHDVVRYPEDWDGDVAKLAVDNQVAAKHERDFRIFLNHLQGRDIREPLEYVEKVRLKNADILIGVLNSCRILATSWTEYGYVGPGGIATIREIGTHTVTRPTFSILGVHHHLLPVNQVESPGARGVTLSLDASKILETAQEVGVHVAIHGHQHMPHIARYQSISLTGSDQSKGLTVVSNGSAGVSAKRRPGEERNTYCVFTFSDDAVRLQMREFRSDSKPGSGLYDGELDASPAMPK